jgi:hypothetical protein
MLKRQTSRFLHTLTNGLCSSGQRPACVNFDDRIILSSDWNSDCREYYNQHKQRQKAGKNSTLHMKNFLKLICNLGLADSTALEQTFQENSPNRQQFGLKVQEKGDGIGANLQKLGDNALHTFFN